MEITDLLIATFKNKASDLHLSTRNPPIMRVHGDITPLNMPPLESGQIKNIGVGTLVLTANVVLLSSYLLGCHSLRHVVGGCVDSLSKAPLGLSGYACVSALNRRHMLWAWCSLFTVGFSDLYVRLCSMGVWSDVRIL